MLQEQDKQKLDGIVKQMLANKESDQNIQMVVDDFKQKYSRQAPVEEKKVGGLQSFIQSVAEPFLKVPTTIAGGLAVGGARLFGSSDTVEKMRDTALEGIDYGYFGNVKPIGAGAFEKYQAGDIGGGEFIARAGADVVGTAAEIGSNFIGGGGAVSTVKTGLKGLIREGVKEGVTVGAKSGALLSFGDSLQDAESKPMDVAYNTLFGTGVGAVAGGVFGAATPVVTKAVKETSKFLKVPELQNKLADGYRKIFNPTARQVKIDTRFGNDSFKFLSEELPDLPIQVNSSGRIEADDAIEMAKLKYSAEAAAYKPIIRNSGEYVDIDNAIYRMKAAAKKEFDGSDLAKAEQQIESEVESFLRNNPQDINVTQSGNRFVTLSRVDDIKSYSWARGKGWGTPEAEVWNDTNNIIGHILKDAIEKKLPSAPIKAMNKRLGQWKNAIDLLEKRNGQVSGSGGKLSKYITRAVGTSIGASLGTGEGIGDNLTGAGTGFLTATALASMMSNPNVRLYVIRKLLNNLAKSGRKDMIQEAEKILKEQATRYLLPAAGKSSYVEKPIILPKNIRETNLGLDEVRNMKSPLNFSSAEEFVKAQGDTVFRGGQPLDISKINEEGLPVSLNKKVAEQFALSKNQFAESPAGQIMGYKKGQNIVETYRISPNAKIATRADIPDDVYAAYKQARPSTNPGVAEPIVNNWAKKNGFDAIDFRTLGTISAEEAEIKILNSEILRTESQLIDIWNKANNKTQ